MGGGLLQLVAYGAQDIYLTGNPQITFFKIVYRRHTNFSMECIPQTINGSSTVSDTYVTAGSVTISRNGDLLSQIYVKADQDIVSGLNGDYLIEDIEIEIGGQRMDKQYREWKQIWTELTTPASKCDGFKYLTGGFKNNLVDFGETRASGKFNNIRLWKIGLQGPDGVQDVINVMNKAVATSGGYGTIFEPTITYHHIFNTNTGYSSNQYKAVSVISNEAWLSDAISTAALSIKKNELVKICKKFNLDIYILNDVNFEKIS